MDYTCTVQVLVHNLYLITRTNDTFIIIEYLPSRLCELPIMSVDVLITKQSVDRKAN